MEYRLKLRLREVEGELEIPFETVEELRSALASLDSGKFSEALSLSGGITSSPLPRTPRPELEGICTLGPRGLPRFSKMPKSDGEYVGLVLFAVEPDSLSPQDIEGITGLERVSSNFLSHSHWNKHFQKGAGGKYQLSPEGKRWVTQIVLPKLKLQKT